ncbi:diguanylate cyclase [Bacillus sp. V3B]|uniref:sensor domain-containing diguanylate cyclase n=1 Tax=Bacillus sp. V3B TaxID=2804915 RepID=UPI00210E3A53|nr:diguanylate cyclase [Bacillus sp. V3B]MCQ6274197.1 diguanylate cyclase [Bacillus sp. V3B]
MKLTIGKKLLGGFLFVLILLVIESVVSNNLISSTEESYKQLIDENIENVLLANSLESDHLKQSGAVKNYLLTGDPTYLSQYEEYKGKVNKTIDHMLKTYKIAEDQEVIQHLEAFQMRYEELVNKAIAFKKDGNEVGYNNLLSTSAKTITNVFKGKIDALVTGQEELVQQGSTEVADAVEKTKETVIYLGIIIFLIGAASAIITSRSISRPLYLLAQYTEKMITPKGKFNLEFPKVKSNIYEVKQLYQSIDLAFREIKHHINQLDIEIQTDALTGLANRRTFDLVIDEQIHNGTSFSLILFDIDFFKKVNDTFGHLQGDDVLRFLARTIQELSREGDLCFRYGGEEFAIIVPYGDYETATVIAERLRMKLESTASPTGEVITISLGISVYPEHGQDAKEIILAADKALYISKSEGRNKTTFYSAG